MKWVLVMVLLNADTGQELSRTEVGRFDEITMCMKGGMEFGAQQPAMGAVMKFECLKIERSETGPVS